MHNQRMNIGILGSGGVAQTLAAGFLTHGHDVTLGTRHPDKLSEWGTKNPAARIGSFADAAASADVIVLKFFTSLDESSMERLQREFAAARFVKAFNSVGAAFMVNPRFAGGPPSMFICGNDEAAKNVARGLLDQFGWETVDLGTAEAARAIEPLCMLWCIPGFLRNEWSHAFKLLR